MDKGQVIAAFQACRDTLRKLPHVPVAAAEGSEALKCEREVGLSWLPERRAHLLWACEQGIEFIRAGRRDKAMRWLGFVQGALWVGGLASIEDLKRINMRQAPCAAED